jgi:hypothetical protein
MKNKKLNKHKIIRHIKEKPISEKRSEKVKPIVIKNFLRLNYDVTKNTYGELLKLKNFLKPFVIIVGVTLIGILLILILK